ncbi:hypothetical protein [Paenibacillus pini]|uniref:Uncharacterized protein n=1 Tax=Paenibacillus pini JCM 16418 TaxID=1236976 RepID=W7YQL7_9BACL|nr:hypothetical protein [Paenibacillus pini]GAF10852.1 hypothetical protein JCM16418_5077 [Paenibacillus pini JCM 16418]
MNPKLTNIEKDLLECILLLRKRHLFTKTLGDGQIQRVTRKDDLTGINVYFHSNLHGEMKVDGEEFLKELR